MLVIGHRVHLEPGVQWLVFNSLHCIDVELHCGESVMCFQFFQFKERGGKNLTCGAGLL